MRYIIKNRSLDLLTPLALCAMVTPVYSQMSRPDSSKSVSEDLFVIAKPAKKNCIVGEAIEIVYELYSATNATTSVAEIPASAGFTNFVIDRTGSINPVTVELNGKSFQVYTLRKILVVPLFAGELTVEPLIAEHIVSASGGTQTANEDVGVDELVNDLLEKEKNLAKLRKFRERSNAITLQVSAQPEAMEEGKNGIAVGKFHIRASMKKNQLKAGDITELEVMVTGNGSLVLSEPPALNLPGNLTLLRTSTAETKDFSKGNQQSSRKFIYQLAINNSGSVTIPPISFGYFDPATQKMELASSEQIVLNIQPAISSMDKPVPSAVSNEVDPKEINPVVKISFAMLLLAMVGGGLLFFRKKSKPNPAIDDLHLENSNVLSTDRLKNADESELYPLLYHSIWSSISSRLKVIPGDQHKKHILDLLRSLGWQKMELDELAMILDECAWRIYAPADVSIDTRKELIRRVSVIIEKLEQTLPSTN